MDRTCGSIVLADRSPAHGKLARQWSCRGHATTVYSPGGPAMIRALKTDEPLLDASAEASTSWLLVVRPDTSSLNTESSRLCTERRVKWTASPVSKVLLLMLSCGASRQKASVVSVALSKRAMRRSWRGLVTLELQLRRGHSFERGLRIDLLLCCPLETRPACPTRAARRAYEVGRAAQSLLQRCRSVSLRPATCTRTCSTAEWTVSRVTC